MRAALTRRLRRLGLTWKNASRILPRDLVSRMMFRWQCGYWPRFERPRTLNEKVWWLKKYYRDPRLRLLADKIAAREYVSEHVPGLHLPEIYRVWESADLVDLNGLPQSYVLKATHGSGMIGLVNPTIDSTALAARVPEWFERRNHGAVFGEWAYGGLTPRVVAEEWLGDHHGNPPPDYKLFVCNGRLVHTAVYVGRFSRMLRYSYSPDWTPLSAIDVAKQRKTETAYALPPAHLLTTATQLAEELARPFPFVRVDLYLVRDAVFFGEATFYPAGGLQPFPDPRLDWVLGAQLTLPIITDQDRRLAWSGSRQDP